MAQRVQVSLVDDLDGGRAAETVMFGLDGMTYQIDLSATNAATLRDALAIYMAAARRPSCRRGGARAATTPPGPRSRIQPADPRMGTIWRAKGLPARSHPVRGDRRIRLLRLTAPSTTRSGGPTRERP
jgi:Lsr2